MLKDALLKRFFRYISIDTTSNPTSTTFPSTLSQLTFANQLKEECEALGLDDVSLDEYGYVFATLPATCTNPAPTIGFIAHMDTAPDFTAKNVSPKIVSNYDGEKITLNEELNIFLDPVQFPVLKKHIGKNLITTDGTSLLGSDDKSGISAIMTAMDFLKNHPEIPHGKIRIAFTPDEEIGNGVKYFDTKRFGADFAYTIDGGPIGEVQSQTFNAASAHIVFNGVSVHPGTAKNQLVNSIHLSQQFHALLPCDEVPEKTAKLEGFYMLHDICGTVNQTISDYIIRDHDMTNFEKRKQVMLDAAKTINNLYGNDTVNIEIKDSYYNMSKIIKQHPLVMNLANQALNNLGITPNDDPIRGGTDGARLSFMGLPCPNIFTGGYNFHGRFEFLVIDEWIKSCEVIIEIARLSTTL
ncbi:MAG: peptidase T [Cellulosilyticaceae bacterium]